MLIFQGYTSVFDDIFQGYKSVSEFLGVYMYTLQTFCRILNTFDLIFVIYNLYANSSQIDILSWSGLRNVKNFRFGFLTWTQKMCSYSTLACPNEFY